MEDRKFTEREVVAANHFLAGSVVTIFGKNVPISASFGSIFSLPDQAFRQAASG